MPKRLPASDVSTSGPKRSAQNVYVLQWARFTAVESANETFRPEVDACTKAALEEIVVDDAGSVRAYRSHCAALAARADLLRDKIEEARTTVRRGLKLSAAQWKRARKEELIAELCDERSFGVEYAAPGEPTAEMAPPHWWTQQPAHKGAEHNAKDGDQVHYELVWGSAESCGPSKSAAAEVSELIDACDEIVTRVRCWVETLPLV